MIPAMGAARRITLPRHALAGLRGIAQHDPATLPSGRPPHIHRSAATAAARRAATRPHPAPRPPHPLPRPRAGASKGSGLHASRVPAQGRDSATPHPARFTHAPRNAPFRKSLYFNGISMLSRVKAPRRGLSRSGPPGGGSSPRAGSPRRRRTRPRRGRTARRCSGPAIRAGYGPTSPAG